MINQHVAAPTSTRQSSSAQEIESLTAYSVEYALDGFRTNLAHLLCLKVPLPEVLEALSNATNGNLYDSSERATDLMSRTHLEEPVRRSKPVRPMPFDSSREGHAAHFLFTLDDHNSGGAQPGQ
jgi:hypothetical protein